MKIGIITFHRAHNFGAVLQAYSLLTTLKASGHDVEFVDYWPDYMSKQYELVKWKFYFNNKKTSKMSRLKIYIQRAISFPERLIRFYKFNKFITDNYSLSDNTFKVGEHIDGRYDLIIYGSDQIWRKNNESSFMGFDDVYFGMYPKHVKKLSYAASMGVEELSREDEVNLSGLLSNFDVITVREDTLVDKLQGLIKPRIEHVIDPVFLLSREHWKSLTKTKRAGKKKYLLLYQLIRSPESEHLAKKIAHERNLEIVEIRGTVKPFSWFSPILTTTGPLDFIAMIQNADFVVSTSFHGVAFSILFQKQFYAMGFRNNSSRVASLLRLLGIENRMIELGTTVNSDDINYVAVEDKLQFEVSRSRQILLSAIQSSQ